MGHEIGWYGYYLSGAGWLLSLVTSKPLKFPETEQNASGEASDQNHPTTDDCLVAILNLTRQLEKSPQNRSELLASRGSFHRELNNWDAAIADLDAALASTPDPYGDTYLNRAIALLETNNPDRASDDIEKAIDYFLEEEDAEYLNYARELNLEILLKLERYENLIDECDVLLTTSVHDDKKLKTFKACAFSAMGRNLEAINQLNSIIDVVDQNDISNDIQMSALHARAGAYLELGHITEAVADINRLQSAEGLTAGNLSLLGLAEIQSKDFRAARNCYQKAVDLDPSLPTNYSQLAVIQAGCPEARFRNGTQAEVNARKACELTDWNDWSCISVLAAAKAELGDFDEAVEFAEWALRLAPDREKGDRQKRVKQYKNGKPFRIDDALPRTIYRRD